MRSVFFLILVLAAVSVGTIWAGAYGMGPVVMTKQYEYKIILRLGNPRKTITEPGLTWKIPGLEDELTYDKRLQYLNASPVEREIGNNERLIIDYYVVWRIEDPLAYRRSFPRGIDEARGAIQSTVESMVGAAVGKLTMSELLGRAAGLDDLSQAAESEMSEFGVRIIDVRINRTELPRKTEEAALDQMREQRRAISRERRAVGERQAREIRANAEREAREVVAEATRKAEITRGDGDAEAARIYADAYSQDPDFYALVRSLEAYRKTLGDKTTFVMPPQHEFFRFLEPSRAMGEPRPAVSAPPAR